MHDGRDIFGEEVTDFLNRSVSIEQIRKGCLRAHCVNGLVWTNARMMNLGEAEFRSYGPPAGRQTLYFSIIPIVAYV